MTPEMKFSIVIPVYNRASQVKHAIDSVLNQSYHNFEVIVVDDGSTDSTKQVVKSITDKRITYLYQENRERGAARNTGTHHASGNFVTYLDSDDEFLSDHLLKVAEYISSNPGFDVYCTAYEKVSESKIERIHIPENIATQLVNGNFLSCNGVFITKETCSQFQFNEDRIMAGLEDWELWLRIGSAKKMKAAQLFTSRMNHHTNRSVLLTERHEIEERFKWFFHAVKSNASTSLFYKNSLRQLESSGETYMALHLAMTKKYRSSAFGHLWKGFTLSPSIVFTKRFYAILKRIL